MNTKTCTKCFKEKPEEDFAPFHSSNPRRRRSRCRECNNSGAWKRENRESHNLQMLIGRFRRMGIDISVEEYQRLLAKQDGLCAICKRPEKQIRNGRPYNLSVDHCHETDKIRGLLCSNCNNGIGRFEDNPDYLKAAAIYLSSS